MYKFKFGTMILILVIGQAVVRSTIIGQQMAALGGQALAVAEALNKELINIKQQLFDEQQRFLVAQQELVCSLEAKNDEISRLTQKLKLVLEDKVGVERREGLLQTKLHCANQRLAKASGLVNAFMQQYLQSSLPRWNTAEHDAVEKIQYSLACRHNPNCGELSSAFDKGDPIRDCLT